MATVILHKGDLDLLRHIAGEDVPGLVWGAAIGECVSWLHYHGYVTRKLKDGAVVYEVTDKGREAIAKASKLSAGGYVKA